MPIATAEVVPLAIAQSVQSEITQTQAERWQQEGEALHQQGNGSAAEEKFKQALVAYQEQGNRLGEAQVLLVLGEIAYRAGEWEAAIATYENALAIAQVLADPSLEASALLGLAQGSSFYNSARYYRQAFTLAQAHQDPVNMGRALLGLGGLQLLNGGSEQTLEKYQQALSLFRSAGDRPYEIRALIRISSLFWNGPEDDASKVLDFLYEGLAIAQEIGDVYTTHALLIEIGSVYAVQEDYPTALDYHQSSLSLAQQSNNSDYLLRSLIAIALFYQRQENYAEAISYYEQHLTLAMDLGDYQAVDVVIGLMTQTDWPNHGLALNYLREKLPEYQAAGDVQSIVASAKGISFGIHEQPELIIAYLKDCLDIVKVIGEPQDVAAIYTALGSVHDRDSSEIAIENYQAALVIYQELDEPEKVAEIWQVMGDAYLLRTADNRRLEAYQQALSIYQTLNNQRESANLLQKIAAVYNWSREYEQAHEAYQQSITIYRELDELGFVAEVLIEVGSLYQRQNKYDRAIDSYQQAFELYQIVGIDYFLVRALEKIALLYHEQQQHEQALDYHQKVLAIHEQNNNRIQIISTLGHIFEVYIEQAQYPLALENAQERITLLMADRPTQWLLMGAWEDLGDAHRLMGDDEPAQAAYQQQLAIAQELDEPFLLIPALNNLGDLYLQQEAYGQALTFYQQSLDLSRAIDNELLVAQHLNNLGVAYQAQGDHEQALAQYQQVLEIYEANESNRVEFALTLAKIANLWATQGEITPAIDHFEQAIAIHETHRKQIRQALPNPALSRYWASSPQAFEARYIVHVETTYQDFAQFLEQQGQPERAAQILDLLAIPSGENE
ncbi:MAG: tetratricopeptide repeat protein [Cyanobacteria bacterium P01_G01_bin.54]